MDVEIVKITKEEYRELLDDQEKLQALQECGVDNWPGYIEAVQLLEKWRSTSSNGADQ